MLNVLSLFDGMSCGQLALQKLGFESGFDYNYYASEIDKYAMQVTQKNFPNTIQVGDIKYLKCESGDNFLHNSPNGINIIDLPIDLLIGGSPCQGFSFAGKQLNFDDERSKLFFEYVRILNEVKPKYFLLENVKMKKEYQEIISQHLFGVKPIEINSSLVSAQNRKRLYWVGELQSGGTYKQVKIEQPEDKGVLLKDILEDEVDEKYYLTEDNYKNYQRDFGSKGKIIENLNSKTPTIIASMGTGGGNTPCILTPGIIQLNNPSHSNNRIYSDEGKSPTLNTMQGGHRQPKIAYAIGIREFEATGWKEDKSPTICARDYKDPKVIYEGVSVRKITPLECERLQTIPDNYTDCVSNSQRYKMIGNGWTVDIISHIFSQLGIKK